MLTEAPFPWLLAGLLVLVCVVAEAAPPPGQMLRREVPGDLPVVTEGAAQAALVVSGEPEVREAAQTFVAAVRAQTGASVPVVAETEVAEADGRTLRAEYRQRHLILVGNALSNRAILPLYCRWLDAADGAYPGEDGYELRTVVNPYGTGANHLVVGGSTPAGARRGLEALQARLPAATSAKSLVLPQMLEVRVGPRLKPTFDQAVAQVKANPVRPIGAVMTNGALSDMCNDALRYAWTGERAFAERAAGTLREMNKRFDGEYYHGDVRTCDDYALEYAVRGWLVLQHAGVLTPDELWESDRNLYRDVPFSAHGPGNVGSRHLASGSMAWFLALDGLLTYANPDPEARQQLEAWREGVRAYFHGACRTYRGDVDQAQDYGAMENVFRYAIHDGHWEYFGSGWADRTIGQMLMNVDNQGWYSGVGGYGEAMPGSLNYPVAIGVCLPITAFVEHRGDLRWIQENVPNLGGAHLGFQVLGVHGFAMGDYVPAEPPRGALTGLTALPLDEYHWKLGQTPITEGVGPVTTPLERCLDKVMLREGFGKDDQYLLLNGYQNTVMGCVDGNALVRFCDQGEVLLFQSTQEEGHDTKNAVYVSNGRNDDLLEGCVEAGPMADLGEVCFTSSTLPRYHGTDWERCLFWRKGGVLVVMDRVAVKEPGRYAMDCAWRSPRYARLTTDGSWEARTEKGMFVVRAADMNRATPTESRDGETAVEAGAGRRLTSALGNDRFAAEPPWVLRDSRRVEATAGEVVDFQNAVYLRDGADHRLTRLSDRAALLRTTSTRRGVAVTDIELLARGSLDLGQDLEARTDFVWLGTDDIHLSGLTLLRVGDDCGVSASAPVDLVLRRRGGSVSGWVRATAETTLQVRIPWLRAATVGGQEREGGSGVLSWTVGTGTHELRLRGGSRLFSQTAAAIEDALAAAHSTAPTHQERPPTVPPAPLRSVWAYDGLRAPGARERNLTVTHRVDGGEARPGPYAVVRDNVFMHTISPHAVTSWKAGEVQLDLKLTTTRTVVGVRLHNYYGTTDFDLVKPDPGQVTEVAVSGDDFAKDKRVLPAATRRYQYLRGCYGSQYFSEVVDDAGGAPEQATAVRVTLRPPAGGAEVRVGRVDVLVDGPGDTTPLKSQSITWGPDNAPHLALWDPDAGRLAVLDAMGKPIWDKDLAAAITGVCCADLDGDGVNELAVTAADWKVRLFAADGAERVVKDWRGVYEQTGGKYYYGGMPHGVGVYNRPGQKEKDLAIGHYYFLTTLGLDGEIKKSLEGTACYWQDFLDAGVDLNGDGLTELLVYSETPWQTKVPVVALDSTKQEPLSSFAAGNGGARLFETLKIGDETCVAVGSHKGCGIYSLTKGAYKWYLAGETFKSSFFLTDFEGDGRPEMLIGQRDGFLLAVDLDGKIVRQVEVGEGVLAVGALPGPKGLMLLASTANETRCYDASGKPVGRFPLVAQRLTATSHEGQPALLALHVDGRVELVAGR